jgi:hypothetical protein
MYKVPKFSHRILYWSVVWLVVYMPFGSLLVGCLFICLLAICW